MCTKQYRVPSTECREDSLRLSTLSTQHPALSTQCGASLIELIMFVMIIGIALAGILLVMNQTTGHSADALVRKQALVVAESLLEEIEAHAFSNPGGFTPAIPGSPTQLERANFDDVTDYNGFATAGVFPADGTPTGVPGLGNYNVAAAVTVLPAAWGTIPAASAVQITVMVTDTAGQVTTATGYRTNY